MSAGPGGAPGVPGPEIFLPALREPVAAIARKLAGIELAAVSGSPAPAWRKVVFVDGGPRRARLVLSFDERLEGLLRVALYAGMGLPFVPGEEDEALAELGNCFMGHIDGRLAGLGLDLAFSIPGVAPGVDAPGEDEVTAAAAVLESAAGAMGITLYLRGAGAEAPANQGRLVDRQGDV